MKKMTIKKSSPLVWAIPALAVLAAILVPMALRDGGSGPSGPPPDGTTFRIYITSELNGYREPCG